MSHLRITIHHLSSDRHAPSAMTKMTQVDHHGKIIVGDCSQHAKRLSTAHRLVRCNGKTKTLFWVLILHEQCTVWFLHFNINSG